MYEVKAYKKCARFWATLYSLLAALLRVWQLKHRDVIFATKVRRTANVWQRSVDFLKISCISISTTNFVLLAWFYLFKFLSTMASPDGITRIWVLKSAPHSISAVLFHPSLGARRSQRFPGRLGSGIPCFPLLYVPYWNDLRPNRSTSAHRFYLGL